MDGSDDLVRLLLKSQPRAGGDPAHDRGHVLRVWANVRAIAAGEGVAVGPVLTAAAILHDVVALPKNHPERSRAAEMSGRKGWAIVRDLGFAREDCDAVAHAIAAHSFSGGVAPATIEAKILRDADRLDALGAVGIARCFAVSGALSRPLWDAEDPFAQVRTVDDGRFALDHFAVKLLTLAEGMTTETGRQMAEARTDVIRRFLHDLSIELTV